MNGNLSPQMAGSDASPGAKATIAPVTPAVKAPLSLGVGTNNTFGQATAWAIHRDQNDAPLSLSAQTFGSTYHFPTASTPEEPH